MHHGVFLCGNAPPPLAEKTAREGGEEETDGFLFTPPHPPGGRAPLRASRPRPFLPSPPGRCGRRGLTRRGGGARPAPPAGVSRGPGHRGGTGAGPGPRGMKECRRGIYHWRMAPRRGRLTFRCQTGVSRCPNGGALRLRPPTNFEPLFAPRQIPSASLLALEGGVCVDHSLGPSKMTAQKWSPAIQRAPGKRRFFAPVGRRRSRKRPARATVYRAGPRRHTIPDGRHHPRGGGHHRAPARQPGWGSPVVSSRPTHPCPPSHGSNLRKIPLGGLAPNPVLCAGGGGAPQRRD